MRLEYYEIFNSRFALEHRYNACVFVLGVSSENQVTGTIESNIDTPLPNPFPLASHVTYLLSEQLRDQRIVYFENQDDDISVITNRVKEFEYVVAVSNNNLNEKSLDIKSIKSSIGSVKSVDEIVLSDAHLFSGTSLCPGYVPTHTPDGRLVILQ